MVESAILGYPRIGAKRELKKALEAYWKGEIDAAALEAAGADLRAQNWALLRGLRRIVGVGPRVLIGTSRKRFLAEALGSLEEVEVAEDRRDLATAVTSVIAADAGAWGVRVHDVAATRDALTIATYGREGGRWTSPTRSP